MKQEYLIIVLACILASICFTSKQTIAQKSNENKQQQPKSKYTIGLQFNPYLSNSTIKRLFSGGFEKSYWVAALRFISTQSYQQNLSIGVEAMAFWTDTERYSGQFWNIGPLLKYEFFHYKRLTLYAETVPSINNSIITFKQDNDNIHDKNEFTAGIYFAPGINFHTKNQKWSADLSYKAATYKLVNGKHFAPSFKINFHF